MTAPFEPSSFQVGTVLSRGEPIRLRLCSESEAIAKARELVSPIHKHVAIDAYCGNVQTFAVIHLTHDGYSVKESDWRTWIDGEFAGGFPQGVFS